jgi:hypothetical protein
MMNQTPPPPAPAGAPPKAKAYQAAREQLQRRVRRYKRGFTVATLVGFGALGMAIAHPNLDVFAATFSTSSSSSTPTSSSQGTYFNQQGSSVNGSSTSTQTPVTTSATS